MEIITRNQRAFDAAGRWRELYPDDNFKTCDGPAGIKRKQLEVLGPSPTPNEVDAVIGNTCWTEVRCDECGSTPDDFVIQVGDEPDYDSSTVNLCADCIRQLAGMVGAPLTRKTR